MASLWVRLSGAVCALLLAWSSTLACLAQEASATEKPGAIELRPQYLPRTTMLETRPARAPHRPWLLAAAGTTAAFAAGFAFTEGFSYRAQNQQAVALERTRDQRLSMDARMRAMGQSTEAKLRADILDKVSSVCLAGTIAATGTMLLIWLTGKEKRNAERTKYLLGPMVLRDWAGAGLVLREKF